MRKLLTSLLVDMRQILDCSVTYTFRMCLGGCDLQLQGRDVVRLRSCEVGLCVCVFVFGKEQKNRGEIWKIL